MEFFSVGEVVRLARKRHGMTQEELAFGICAVSTLSKIENGLRRPQSGTFQALMERMGERSEGYLMMTDEKDIRKRRVRERMADAMCIGDAQTLRRLLEIYVCLSARPKQEDHQWITLAQTMLHGWTENETVPTENRLTELLYASCPAYEGNWRKGGQYTYCELLIFQMIVDCRIRRPDFSWCLSVLSEMVSYIEKKCEPSVCFERITVSAYYRLALICFFVGQYSRSAKRCADGLSLCLRSDYYRFTPLLLSLRASALAKLGNTIESQQARESARLADAFVTGQNYLLNFSKL